MRYNTVQLDALGGVPNIGAIIEQIDSAATQATVHMRLHGIRLRPKSLDVPLQDEVDVVLRDLVSSAFIGWREARHEAPAAVPDWQVDGFESDDHFDVVVCGLEGAPAGFMTCSIALRLVG